jgi:hypothetical protein
VRSVKVCGLNPAAGHAEECCMSQPPSATKKTPPLKQVPANPSPGNDLDQIVSEIGELEQGMEMQAPAEAARDDANLISELDELVTEDTGKPKLSLLDDPEPETSPTAHHAGGETLSLTVQGGTQVTLKFESEGGAVSVSVKDGVLRVEIADGAEFKIPLAA